jgi:hypothetical protein
MAFSGRETHSFIDNSRPSAMGRKQAWASGACSTHANLDVFEQQVLSDALAFVASDSIDVFAVECCLEQLAL